MALCFNVIKAGWLGNEQWFLFSLCRSTAAAEGSEPCVDGADAQQASDVGGHIQSVSTLQRQRPRGHRHGSTCPGGASPEELAEPPGWGTLGNTHTHRYNQTYLLRTSWTFPEPCLCWSCITTPLNFIWELLLLFSTGNTSTWCPANSACYCLSTLFKAGSLSCLPFIRVVLLLI